LSDREACIVQLLDPNSRYWLISISDENLRKCFELGVYGSPNMRVREKIKMGDYLVFYVAAGRSKDKGKVFAAIARVASEWYEEDVPLWPDEVGGVKYPLRIKVDFVCEGEVPLEGIRDSLIFLRDYKPSNIGLVFMGTPANKGEPLSYDDVLIIAKHMSCRCRAKCHEPSLDEIRNHVIRNLYVNAELVDFINSLLDSGENILLVGPPGTGKTLLAREITLARGYEPYFVVATAHWSRYDLIGGMTLEGGNIKWKSGYLLRALLSHIKNKREFKSTCRGFRGTYLIIDEINRADIDKAFAEFFLIFSSHNPWERIIPMDLVNEIEDYVNRNLADKVAEEFIKELKENFEKVEENGRLLGYRLPSDFRVIATMNFVDARNLFAVGEAFARRFAVVMIDVPGVDRFDMLLNKIYDNIREELAKTIGDADAVLDNVKRLINNLLKELYTKALEKHEAGAPATVITPANLYLTIKTFAVYYASLPEDERKKLEEDQTKLRAILRKCVEISLPLSRLWDRTLGKHVEEIIRDVFEKP